MIQIMKASAGSGKTYALAHEYLSMLNERYAYRHILAVTFTNKATAEMKSRILKFLKESDEDRLQEALRDILHDYSAFAVSTIDKFFQQALKAFAREIGQVADYQIDLDKDALINESMDRILDSLTREDTDLLSWLQRSVNETLKQGRRVALEELLYETGRHLMMEGAGDPAELGKQFGKDRLAAVLENCNGIIDDFTGELEKAAGELDVVNKYSVSQLEEVFRQIKDGQRILMPRTTLMKEARGSAFCELLEGKRYRWYCTAWLIRDMALSLGLAGEFFRSFDALLKEKNIMVLDRSNVILKDIIAGSDAPFVYEKMGVRYENFLLDEFQDTSNIQWENFRPLLQESEANMHRSFIVGDIKQSIYRWRDSDWTLLARKVGEDFPEAETINKQDNWRSLETIVDFNNRFFKYAASVTGHPELYEDVEQIVRSRDAAKGYVRVSYCDKADRTGLVLESISAAREAGAHYDDIGILIRSNKEGGLLANALIEAGIPVVSDESLLLKSSIILQKIIGILSYYENPDDLISRFISEKESLEFPSVFHSLPDLCEALLMQLQSNYPDLFRGETLYIQAFMDDLREWTEANGINLKAYLKHWREKDLAISSPAGSEAVRICTIHKSKGLEFPYVIIPFAESVNFYKGPFKWCPLSTEGTPFIPEAAGSYPVRLEGYIDHTLFSDAYEAERDMQLVDNINVFYVALTRARKGMHIIARKPSKAFIDSLMKAPEYKDFSQILYKFCGCMDDRVYGEMYDFRNMDRDVDTSPEFPYEYVSIPAGKRFTATADASDFFGEDGSTGPAASSRRNGIVLHGILSKVQDADGLPAAVQDAVNGGLLDNEQGEDALKLLSERIKGHPEWFCGRGLNEVALFDGSGKEKRPDRVVLKDGKACVIDYKFGESTPENDRRYSAQVRAYMKLFRTLGYEDVCGFVWYVINDKLISL